MKRDIPMNKKQRLEKALKVHWHRLLYQMFNNISMKNKLIISYVFVVFIPVVLVGLILISDMRKTAIQKAIDETISNANKTERDLEEIFKTLLDVSNRIYVDNNLENIMAKKYQSAWEVVLAFRSYSAFNDYINYYKAIRDIRFYMTKDNLLGDMKYLKTTDEIKNYPWYEKTISKRGLVSWEYTYNETRQEFYLSLTRLVSNTHGAPIGVLVMDVSKDYIYSILENDTYQTMIVNDQGFIIAAKDYSIIGRTLENIGLKDLSPQEGTSVFNCSYQGRKSIATVKTSVPQLSNNVFKIISIFPTDNIISGANKVIISGFVIITVSLILALIIIIIFSRVLSERIRKLSLEMHNIALGNLNTTITVDGEDEIGQLSKDLSVMVKSINNLIHEVYEVNLQRNNMLMLHREIRYKMLVSQVNPHFLFNALEAIRMKAHSIGQDEISEKVKSLGKILRTSLESSRDFIKLEKEIDLVKNYLELQSFRFGNKIRYNLDIKNVPLETRILPFIIQPIVENAVVHGLENKAGDGAVEIKISREGSLLKICIADNGLGIDQEKLSYIRSTLDEQDYPDGRIGLRNVHQRIQLHYGREYGLALQSERDIGTRVEFYLPGEGEAVC